ncbi:BnaA03g50730D [Brassica napus]|uniref:(rape) hypothetical protein n=1 Tax=Brassica napus TaxID=3708 RepID=A0A078IIZ6_BRANA|nr:unnamed protein product [Brassica napus]CDY49384.1 BnaA03g50730D [Brassica napus]
MFGSFIFFRQNYAVMSETFLLLDYNTSVSNCPSVFLCNFRTPTLYHERPCIHCWTTVIYLSKTNLCPAPCVKSNSLISEVHRLQLWRYRYVSPTFFIQFSYTQFPNNGNFVGAASGKTFPALDTRTKEVIANVAEGDAEDINRAMKAARKSIDEGAWPKMIAYENSKIVLRFTYLVEKHSEELAALDTCGNGNTYDQAKTAEIAMIAGLFCNDAGGADKIHGLTIPANGNYHVQTLHEPICVAGQIIPWNFPLLMFA